MTEYAAWLSGEYLSKTRWSEVKTKINGSSDALVRHATYAQSVLSGSSMEISSTMRRHQLKLADRQCRMSALSAKIQNAVTMLVTSLYAMKLNDPLSRKAAVVACNELKRKITGGHPTDAHYRTETKLGASIVNEGWSELHGVQSGRIMERYEDE